MLHATQENWAPNLASKKNDQNLDLQFIKTGIFVQSLQFSSASDVNISGYIWQKYDCDEQFQSAKTKDIKTVADCSKQTTPIPKQGEVGFILPEQLDTAGNITTQEVYRALSETEEWIVVSWYFESTLRQAFKYRPYPFDHRIVRIRLWPKAFQSDITLIPDLDTYESASLVDSFGLEESIVLNSWAIENTYFDFATTRYDTNFGIDRAHQPHHPDLRYNIVLKRKFGQALITYLVPLFLIAALLFTAILIITDNKQLAHKIGLKTSVFMTLSAILFLTVMLLHIQIRDELLGANISYIEYICILMYAFLAMASANVYLFSVRSTVFKGILLKHNNLYPKLWYWPAFIGLLILMTTASI